MKLTFRLSPFLLCAGIASAAAAPLQYTVRDIGSLSPNGGADAVSLNSRAQVVGTSFTANVEVHAFATAPDAGAMIDLCPTAHVCYARAINAAGVVAGYRVDAGSRATSGFIVNADGSGMILTESLGGDITQPQAINNGRQIAGQANRVAGSDLRAYVTAGDGKYPRDLGTLGGPSSQALGINNRGDVVGQSSTRDFFAYRPFIVMHDRPGMLDLGSFGGSLGAAIAINDHGVFTGFSTTASGERHAFVASVHRPALVDLGSLGGSYGAGMSINEAGTIVGSSFTTFDEALHAFIIEAGTKTMIDLNTVATAPGGHYFELGTAINDRGEILAEDNFGNSFLLEPVHK